MSLKALEVGLYGALSVDATLIASVPAARMHRGLAPEDGACPLIEFTVKRKKVSTLGEDNGYYDATVTVKVVDETEDQTLADAAFDRVATLLLPGTFTVAGYTVLGVTRVSDFSYPERDHDRIYQHVGGEFSVLLQKN